MHFYKYQKMHNSESGNQHSPQSTTIDMSTDTCVSGGVQNDSTPKDVHSQWFVV